MSTISNIVYTSAKSRQIAGSPRIHNLSLKVEAMPVKNLSQRFPSVLLAAIALGLPCGAAKAQVAIRYNATVTAVDFPAKTVVATTESVIQPDGTELNYGTPPQNTFAVDASTPIHYANNPARWVSLREVKPGTPLAVYGRTDGGRVLADRILIQASDPNAVRQTAVVPDGQNPIEPDKVCKDRVTVPLIFPIAGKVSYSDSFLASRGGGSRRHHGQDLMSAKLNPAIACFDGVVELNVGLGNAGNTVTIYGDNGWTAEYYHMNNDTPGTDDARGTAEYCFAPGLKSGDRVNAGQLIGWVGDSGNAESTGSHVHFELWNQVTGAVYNAFPSLQAAKRLAQPVVFAPAPDLEIPKGSARYDGVIRKIDRDRKVLVVDLLATDTNGKGLTSVTKPTREFLIADDKSLFRVFGMPDGLTLDNVVVGDRISSIARMTPPGHGQELTQLFAVRNLNAQMTAPIPPNESTDAGQLAEPAPPPAGGTILLGPDDKYLENLAKEVLEEVNAQRQLKGLKDLVFDAGLARTAQAWTVSMVDGDFFDTRDERIGLSVTSLAARDGTPEATVGLVFDSLDSRALAASLIKNYARDILNPDLKTIGVGHTYIDDDPGQVQRKHYWTILFAR